MLSVRRFIRSAILGSSVCTLAASAHAKALTVLHDFAGPPGDGSFPYNPVTIGPGGTIYGATNLGGSANSGIIFKLAKDGTETLLHSFDGGSGGSDPNAGVTLDPKTGNIYGTATFGGGEGCRNGCGVFYELAADGTYTVIHSFTGGSDGENPAGSLVRDRQGNYYGLATSGGPNGGGMVFKYTGKGGLKVLHGFGGSDGFQPQGSLLLDKSGTLYGVTESGGADDYGVVYRLGTNGKGFSVLYSFTGGADGGYPSGGLASDKAGNLYGATNLAGNGQDPNGTVFRLAPDGSVTTLYVFTGGADGGYPAGDVLQSGGKIYGTTTGGGADQDGVVYAVDAVKGGEKVVHSFTGDDGAGPQAGLTEYHKRLYGTAGGGGTDNYGVVFRMKMK
ncbi:MAG TPA: choice-of-anchor tandem repeat GloVer-containing protein [Rhizomicrobium sp.]